MRHAVSLARRRRVVDDGLALFAGLRRSIVSGDMGVTLIARKFLPWSSAS
jgi:hypothetical protein